MDQFEVLQIKLKLSLIEMKIHPFHALSQKPQRQPSKAIKVTPKLDMEFETQYSFYMDIHVKKYKKGALLWTPCVGPKMKVVVHIYSS